MGIEIESNKATKSIAVFLSFFGKGKLSEEVLEEKIQSFLIEDETLKFSIHLQLFLALNDTSLDSVRDTDLTAPLSPTTDVGVLSHKTYLHLVDELDLNEEFIKMMEASAHVSPLLSDLLLKSLENFDDLSLKYKSHYLYVLSKISSFDENYSNYTAKYFNIFINSKVPKMNKIEVALKIAGLPGLYDTKGDNWEEFHELSPEWDFDFLKFGLKTYEVFKEIFPSKKVPSYPTTLVSQIDEYLARFSLLPSDEELILWMKTIKGRLSLLEYLGGIAYSSHLIMTHFKIPVGSSKLLELAGNLRFEKPKVQPEEFQFSSIDQFCVEFKSQFRRERYRKIWIEALLNFENPLDSPCGLDVAEIHIPLNADFDIMLKLIEVLEKSENLCDKKKELLLSSFAAQKVFERRDEFLNKIFANGANRRLAKENFKIGLSTLTSRLCHVSQSEILQGYRNQKKIKDSWEYVVFTLGIQDSLKTVEELLRGGFRSGNYEPLRLTVPFHHFKLSCGKEVFHAAIESILTDPKPRCSGKAISALPNLIKENLTTFAELEALIRLATIEAEIDGSEENIVLCQRLFTSYSTLLNSYPELASVDSNVTKHLKSSLLLTYNVGNPTGRGKSILFNIREIILQLGVTIGGQIREIIVEDEDLDDKTFTSLSLIFIRCVCNGALIKEALISRIEKLEHLNTVAYCVNIVLNSCQSEFKKVEELFHLIFQNSQLFPSEISLWSRVVLNGFYVGKRCEHGGHFLTAYKGFLGERKEFEDVKEIIQTLTWAGTRGGCIRTIMLTMINLLENLNRNVIEEEGNVIKDCLLLLERKISDVGFPLRTVILGYVDGNKKEFQKTMSNERKEKIENALKEMKDETGTCSVDEDEDPAEDRKLFPFNNTLPPAPPPETVAQIPLIS